MESIQINEDKTLQYFLKLIPDFSVFDIAERECIRQLTDLNQNTFNKLFFYDPNPIVNEKSDGNNTFYQYTINSPFRRAVFRFSFEKNEGIPILSTGSELHIATKRCTGKGDSDEYVIDEKSGDYIIHDKSHNVITEKTPTNTKFISIKSADSKYNSFVIDNYNTKYLIVIDERGESSGIFNVNINNYYNDSGLQPVIGVCF